MALTERNTELDAKAHEVEAAGNRAAMARVRLEQEKEILERHNEWLNAELARKTEAYQQERTGATAQASPGPEHAECRRDVPGAAVMCQTSAGRIQSRLAWCYSDVPNSRTPATPYVVCQCPSQCVRHRQKLRLATRRVLCGWELIHWVVRLAKAAVAAQASLNRQRLPRYHSYPNVQLMPKATNFAQYGNPVGADLPQHRRAAYLFMHITSYYQLLCIYCYLILWCCMPAHTWPLNMVRCSAGAGAAAEAVRRGGARAAAGGGAGAAQGAACAGRAGPRGAPECLCLCKHHS